MKKLLELLKKLLQFILGLFKKKNDTTPEPDENKGEDSGETNGPIFDLNMYVGLDVNHRCYKATINNNNKYKMTSHYGIVVHDTGAGSPNKQLKRWYQPDKSNDNYDEIIEAVGYNKNGNGSNNTTGDKIAHAYIGELADGVTVGIGQALPFEGFPCWSCAGGSKGSFNGDPTACLQVEVARGKDSDLDYYHKAYYRLIELLAYWCHTYNIPVDRVYSHLEAHKLGYASDHGDIDDYLKLDNKTMNDLRKDLQERLTEIK